MFPLAGGIFLSCDHGLDYLHQLTYVMRIQPIKSTKRRKLYGISVEDFSSSAPSTLLVVCSAASVYLPPMTTSPVSSMCFPEKAGV